MRVPGRPPKNPSDCGFEIEIEFVSVITSKLLGSPCTTVGTAHVPVAP
jgi:hypothetical protein